MGIEHTPAKRVGDIWESTEEVVVKVHQEKVSQQDEESRFYEVSLA